jgi:glycerol-3-phosphate acyltransferase PlsY
MHSWPNTIVASTVFGYFLGSIPFGYLLVRAFRGTDVRATGSGNIGATNVARTSPILGLSTLLLDLFKGLAAVWITATVFSGDRSVAFAAGLAAICGHVFPVWLRFRGGKGVATGLGSFLLLTPKAILIAFGIFVVMGFAFRYISLASITAAALLPVMAFALGEARTPAQIALISCACLLIIAKHNPNIRRLLAGTEPKFRAKRA